MFIDPILSWLQNSVVAHAISKSNHLVGASLQIFHVLGFVLLLASLAMVNLRLLGLALTHQPLPNISRAGTRLLWWGFALAAASGALMFIASPKLYFYKPVFQLKMLLLAAAVVVQAVYFRKVAAQQSPRLAQARTTVLLSSTSWFGVALAGRIIGFV